MTDAFSRSGVEGYQRSLAMRHFHLSILQPELVKKYSSFPGKTMMYMEERSCRSQFMNEVLEFMMDYPVYEKTGESFSKLMRMERAIYLEFRQNVREICDRKAKEELERNLRRKQEEEHRQQLEKQKRDREQREMARRNKQTTANRRGPVYF